MTSEQFVELSTRVVKDLKSWSEEATRSTFVSPTDLVELERAADIIDRVTVHVAATGGTLDTNTGA